MTPFSLRVATPFSFSFFLGRGQLPPQYMYNLQSVGGGAGAGGGIESPVYHFSTILTMLYPHLKEILRTYNKNNPSCRLCHCRYEGLNVDNHTFASRKVIFKI